jgi:3',5'-cyclic-AMP phosphodiesterase
MILAQLTDAHVGPPGPQRGGYDGAAALARVVAAVRALAPRPDLVLFTGDLADAGTAGEYATVVRLLAPLGMPVAAVPGNHDRRDGFRAAFGGGRVRIGSGDFLNLVIDELPVRLVGLDTVVEDALGGLLCAARLDWLDATLGAEPERPTLVFMHHPPFRTGIPFMDSIGCGNAEGLAAVLERHRQVVRVVAGHVHRAVEASVAGRAASVCPSVGWELPLELADPAPLAFVPAPPAVQLHLWDGARFLTHTLRLAAE